MSDPREAGMTEEELREEQEHEGPVVRDRRRVDPETGELRAPVDTPAPAAPAAAAAEEIRQAAAGDDGELAQQVATLQAELDARVADLKRVQAEYANYRKRVDRDRSAVREQALANVITDLLPVLDDIGRAREHDELHGGFRQVAESLEQVVTKLGLVRFGEPGDAFDPTVHEALMHSYSGDVEEPTCAQILQSGYAVHERVLRPARVAVTEPDTPVGNQAGAAGDTSDQAGAAGDTSDDTTSES